MTDKADSDKIVVSKRTVVRVIAGLLAVGVAGGVFTLGRASSSHGSRTSLRPASAALPAPIVSTTSTPTVPPTSSTSTTSTSTTTPSPLRVVVSTPPPPTAISVTEVPGPGTSESSGTTLDYRIEAPYSCNLEVGFSFGYQGASGHDPPVHVAHDTVYGPDGMDTVLVGTVDPIAGTVYPIGEQGGMAPLGFYPLRGEVDILANDHVALDVLRCTNGPSVVRATVDASNPVLGVPDILVTPGVQP